MITYDYTCNSCDFIFTFLQDTYEKKHNPKICPKCQAKKPIRQWSPGYGRSFYMPGQPRHRRGMCRAKLAPIYPSYSKEDL